ncbi:glycosyltransferase [Myxococcota bacterium]|nr:glycosyltransferase [Myxococcota bacterium]
MRVLKIFDGDSPGDIRVERITRSLVTAGHEVVVVCRNKAGRPRSERIPDDAHVERLSSTTERWAFLSFPYFFNPLWIWTVLRITWRYRPDLVLARDLLIAPLGILAARLASVPVVADLAEPYPDTLRTHLQSANPKRHDYPIRNTCLADLVERFVVRRIAASVVVCPKAGWRLVEQGHSPDAWVEVRNAAILARFAPVGERPEVMHGFESRTRVLFSDLISHDPGGRNRHRRDREASQEASASLRAPDHRRGTDAR